MIVFPTTVQNFEVDWPQVKRVSGISSVRSKFEANRFNTDISQESILKQIANKDAYNYLGNKWFMKNDKKTPTPAEVLNGIKIENMAHLRLTGDLTNSSIALDTYFEWDALFAQKISPHKMDK